jgi:hypothetical protein
LTEECLIAKSHPIGVVLKLRPGGRSAPVNYHALRGRFIIIPRTRAHSFAYYQVLSYSLLS